MGFTITDNFALYRPRAACCFIDTVSASTRSKGVLLPGHLLEVEEAVSAFGAANLNSLEWFEYKTVAQDPDGDPENPTYILVDGPTVSSAWSFEHNYPGVPYGRAKAQTQFVIHLDRPWRAEDGPGLEVAQGRESLRYEWSDEHGYEYGGITRSESTSVVTFSAGATSGLCPIQTWTSQGIEGIISRSGPPASDIEFNVANDRGGTFSHGVGRPPAGLDGWGRMGLQMMYADRRSGVAYPTTLHFGSLVAGLYGDVHIDFTTETLNAEGASEGQGAGHVVIRDPFEGATYDIPAPDTDGSRTYAHSFTSSTSQYFANPVIKGTVVCVDNI